MEETKKLTMKKRVLSVFLGMLVLMALLAFASITSFAATSGDYEYTVLSDGTAQITGYTGNASNLAIPSRIDGYTVTEIGYGAFSHCESLTSITIPGSVIQILDEAFCYCTNVSSIVIPDSVVSISRFAFGYCKSLKSIVIPDSMTSLHDSLFFGCSSLESVSLPDSLKWLGEYTFYKCSSLKSIRIPSGVTSLGQYVFYKCSSLKWITIHDNVTSIDFYDFPSLKDIYYTGSKSQWVSIRKSGELPASITIHYDSDGEPKLPILANTTTGIKITWDKVEGAEKYRVFYKTAGGSWTGIANTTSTSYTWTDAKSGTKYAFTVRCIDNAGNYTSGYDATGKSITYIAAPKLSAVKNTATGVNITWGKVAGAAKYRVFYKTGNGSWTGIANTTATSYTWTGAKSGTKYTFTVRCLDKDGNYISSFDSTGKSITYIAAPKLSAVKNTATGVNITWGKVAGAAKYRVFYKTGNGSWTGIANTTATSYTWTGAKSGTKYTFTVRCLDKDGNYISSFDSTGKSITYVAAPKLSAVKNTATGVNITWGKVTGAAKYRVFYKTAGGSWTGIANTTATSYTWTGAKSGTKYTFTVLCLDKNGNYISSFDSTGKSITYVAAPKLSAVKNTATGVNITWEKSAGAVKYRVFYKTGNGTWTKIADTTSTSYTWKGGKAGTKYTFTVRCVDKDGKSYTSSFDGTGKSLTRK